MKNRLRIVGTIILLLLGLLQCIGYIFKQPLIRGLGMASAASPLPLVFSHFKSLETFSSKFEIDLLSSGPNSAKKIETYEVIPKLYSKMKGPYNRRNVYGAVIAYGPKLEGDTGKLRDEILRYGLCPNGPLVQEFELPKDFSQAVVRVIPKQTSDPTFESNPQEIKVICAEQ